MKTIKSALAAIALGGMLSTPAISAGGETHTADVDFSFEGPLGVFDRGELQRGLQIYREVCSVCHGMKFVSFRTLADEGGPMLDAAAVKAIAAEYDVADEAGEPGDTRSGKPSDYFPNIKSAGAPDLSLMAKAREGGPAHIYSILTGYTGEEKEIAGSILYENTAYPGGWISMGSPLATADVEYADGTEASMEHMAHDVSAFLMWAAEPKMVERKQAGVRNILFLVIFAVLLFFVNRRLWSKVKHPE